METKEKHPEQADFTVPKGAKLLVINEASYDHF
jgi:hypothetical protein